MTDYTALVAKWATLTPGTTVVKLAQLNAITVTGQVPTSFFVTGDQLLNCINYAEFKVLAAVDQANILSICRTPGQLLGGSGSTSFIVDGIIIDKFPLAGPTVAALTALAKGSVTPWWQATVAQGGGGLTGPVTPPDLVAAGNLT